MPLILVQRAMVGAPAGATLVKAPPLLSSNSPPTSGVSSPPSSQPVFPLLLVGGGGATLQLLQQLSVSPGLTTASGLHHVSAPGRLAPETQWCTALLI